MNFCVFILENGWILSTGIGLIVDVKLNGDLFWNFFGNLFYS